MPLYFFHTLCSGVCNTSRVSLETTKGPSPYSHQATTCPIGIEICNQGCRLCSTNLAEPLASYGASLSGSGKAFRNLGNCQNHNIDSSSKVDYCQRCSLWCQLQVCCIQDRRSTSAICRDSSTTGKLAMVESPEALLGLCSPSGQRTGGTSRALASRSLPHTLRAFHA